jgi:nicotinamidase/pyrazinamidase
MQNDFVLPTGSLSVSGAPSIVPIVNHLRRLFQTVVWTQDWHPPDHISFVGSHPGGQPFDAVDVGAYTQVLFPANCVAGTEGAALHAELDTKSRDVVVKKGTRRDMDSFSYFFDVIKSSATIAHQQLKQRGIRMLFIAGIATDFCVRASVLDARELGYQVVVIEDAIAPDEGARAFDEMKVKGARFVSSARVKF